MSLEQLADIFGVNKTTVMRWEDRRVPAERVIEIEARTGIPRHDLRPDIYPDAKQPLPASSSA
jgi:DNA-binding transcriptional regulator YdaS (Cro superfamily)